jgi:hypothetical protein
MDAIRISSRKYGENGGIRLEVSTTQDVTSAWTKHFHNAKDIRSLLLELAPEESPKITEFITATVNFGDEHVVISCQEKDFSQHGFEKLAGARS